jgi:hypothetical protein
MIISEPNDFVADVFGDPMPSRAVNPRVQGPTKYRPNFRAAAKWRRDGP